jgi:superfamily I DNA/RNA helicase
LKVNYRTSHQIRQSADRLLPAVVRDVDGIEEDRRGTVSIFNGPDPEIVLHPDEDDEIRAIGMVIHEAVDDGMPPEEIGVFVRSEDELPRARNAVKEAAQTPLELSDRVEDRTGRIAIGTMHLAKGLEFRQVIVMACDEEILPDQDRIDTVADEVELDEVYDTERHLFYVACTRAREKLTVSGVSPASEFFADLKGG